MNPFIKCLRSVRGTATVVISCDFPERILNRMAANRIPFWDIRPDADGYRVCVYLSSLKRLDALCKDTPFQVRLVQQTGLPCLVKRYKNRYGILIGLILFAVILTELQSRLWDIRIVGVDPSVQANISAVLSEENIVNGCRMNRIPTEELKQTLPIQIPELAWVSVNRQGSTLLISASAAQKSHTLQNEQPVNLVASCDGIVQSVDVSRGVSVVTPGQTVAANQLLISGVIVHDHINTFVPAKGTVMALIKEPFSYTFEDSVEIRTPSADPYRQYLLQIYTQKIPLYMGEPLRPHDLAVEKKQVSMFGKRLPFSVYCRCITPIALTYHNYEPQEIPALLDKRLQREIMTDRYSIEQLQIRHTNGHYVAQGLVVYEKNIVKSEKIKIFSENRE